ncbi:MAG TPA: hypothetical protein VHN14_15030 [Kofleriaceae bacterium]|nr:hypothetical protein [Kofleriaceae bacterium]
MRRDSLAGGHDPGRLAKFQFDAYDSDGIYLTAIGDAFIRQASGANGATLAYLRQGERALIYYVDDNSSSCAGGTQIGASAGPAGAGVY